MPRADNNPPLIRRTHRATEPELCLTAGWRSVGCAKTGLIFLTLAPYLFMIYLEYVLRTTIDKNER